jgi:hypothetical protein
MCPIEKLYENAETGCCPRFDPKPWDGKEIKWKDRLFLKERVFCPFHIPIGIDKMMVRDMELIKNAAALAEVPMMLFDFTSLFGADAYIAVSKEVPGKEMARLSGTYLSRVFEGEFKDTGKWMEEMKAFVKGKGKTMKRLYHFYTTCPACAKAYGKNYVVMLAEV